jgi:DNA primase catalytic subunit
LKRFKTRRCVIFAGVAAVEKTNYYLPKGMRYSTLGERREFYLKEFSFAPVVKWFGSSRNPLQTKYAVIIGRHTHVFKKEFERDIKEPVIIDDYASLDEVRRMIRRFAPEGVYFDRNQYRDKSKCASAACARRFCWNCANFLGQDLAFDLDPENVVCPIHGSLAQKMARHQGLGFCEWEFNEIRRQSIELYETLAADFEKIKIVYSGRGLHLHVDDERALKMRRGERKALAARVGRRFAIDEWVTEGSSRLIRLPFSLHAMVSRVVTPLTLGELKRFNPVTAKKCLPLFAKKQKTKIRSD